MIVSVDSGENHGTPESGRTVLRLGFEWGPFQRNITIEKCAALALIYGCPLPPPPPPPPFFSLHLVIIITD
jgi:hypothetical protein